MMDGISHGEFLCFGLDKKGFILYHIHVTVVFYLFKFFFVARRYQGLFIYFIRCAYKKREGLSQQFCDGIQVNFLSFTNLGLPVLNPIFP